MFFYVFLFFVYINFLRSFTSKCYSQFPQIEWVEFRDDFPYLMIANYIQISSNYIHTYIKQFKIFPEILNGLVTSNSFDYFTIFISIHDQLYILCNSSLLLHQFKIVHSYISMPYSYQGTYSTLGKFEIVTPRTNKYLISAREFTLQILCLFMHAHNSAIAVV